MEFGQKEFGVAFKTAFYVSREIFWVKNLLEKVYIFLCFFGLWGKIFQLSCQICVLRVHRGSFWEIVFWIFRASQSKLTNHRREKSACWGDDFPFICYCTMENNKSRDKIDACSSMLTIHVESSMVNRYPMARHTEEPSRVFHVLQWVKDVIRWVMYIDDVLWVMDGNLSNKSSVGFFQDKSFFCLVVNCTSRAKKVSVSFGILQLLISCAYWNSQTKLYWWINPDRSYKDFG